MAANIPTSLRTADIGRFAIRAAQLEKAKPVIAYWCESGPNQVPRARLTAVPVAGNFYIVNQIIEKGLHTTDEEVKVYTTNLVEKLEEVGVQPHIRFEAVAKESTG